MYVNALEQELRTYGMRARMHVDQISVARKYYLS